MALAGVIPLAAFSRRWDRLEGPRRFHSHLVSHDSYEASLGFLATWWSQAGGLLIWQLASKREEIEALSPLKAQAWKYQNIASTVSQVTCPAQSQRGRESDFTS